MDISMLIITLISTIATVISCIIAVRSKNESKKILNTIQNINTGIQSIEKNNVEDAGDFGISNSGENDGVIAGKVTGGISNNGKK